MRSSLAFTNIFIVFAVGLCVCSAHAESKKLLDDRQDAQYWLSKIQTAASKLNFSGTFVYQGANQMRTSRISHLWDGKNEFEKLEILDGKPREYIRNNDEITCYEPETKTILIEKNSNHDAFPAIFAISPAELAEHYTFTHSQSERVAEFDCQVVELTPKDNLRYGYKLWTEKSTGLLLRAQTLNSDSDVVEQISFTQIHIGDTDRNRIKPSFNTASGWRVENAVTSQINLSGWSAKKVPSGFKKTREMKRLVSNAYPRTVTSEKTASKSQHEVSQIVYSDGLAAISIFIESDMQNRQEGVMHQGALNIAGKRQGDYWITVVGEVPAAAIMQVVNSIEFNRK